MPVEIPIPGGNTLSFSDDLSNAEIKDYLGVNHAEHFPVYGSRVKLKQGMSELRAQNEDASYLAVPEARDLFAMPTKADFPIPDRITKAFDQVSLGDIGRATAHLAFGDLDLGSAAISGAQDTIADEATNVAAAILPRPVSDTLFPTPSPQLVDAEGVGIPGTERRRAPSLGGQFVEGIKESGPGMLATWSPGGGGQEPGGALERLARGLGAAAGSLPFFVAGGALGATSSGGNPAGAAAGALGYQAYADNMIRSAIQGDKPVYEAFRDSMWEGVKSGGLALATEGFAKVGGIAVQGTGIPSKLVQRSELAAHLSQRGVPAALGKLGSGTFVFGTGAPLLNGNLPGLRDYEDAGALLAVFGIGQRALSSAIAANPGRPLHETVGDVVELSGKVTPQEIAALRASLAEIAAMEPAPLLLPAPNTNWMPPISPMAGPKSVAYGTRGVTGPAPEPAPPGGDNQALYRQVPRGANEPVLARVRQAEALREGVDAGLESIGQVAHNLAEFRRFQAENDLARRPGPEEVALQKVSELEQLRQQQVNAAGAGEANAPSAGSLEPPSLESSIKATERVKSEYADKGFELKGQTAGPNGEQILTFNQPSGTYEHIVPVTFPDIPTPEGSSVPARIAELTKEPGVEVLTTVERGKKVPMMTKNTKDTTTVWFRRRIEVPEDQTYTVRISDKDRVLPANQDPANEHYTVGGVLANKTGLGGPRIEAYSEASKARIEAEIKAKVDAAKALKEQAVTPTTTPETAVSSTQRDFLNDALNAPVEGEITDKIVEDAKTAERSHIEKTLGPELFAQYKKGARSGNFPEGFEDKLSPAQWEAVYGADPAVPDVDLVKAVVRARHENTWPDGLSEADLNRELKSAGHLIADMPDAAKPLEQMKSSEVSSIAGLNEAIKSAERYGISQEDFFKRAATEYGKRFSDPDDARMMVEGLMDKLRASTPTTEATSPITTPESPTLAASGVPQPSAVRDQQPGEPVSGGPRPPYIPAGVEPGALPTGAVRPTSAAEKPTEGVQGARPALEQPTKPIEGVTGKATSVTTGNSPEDMTVPATYTVVERKDLTASHTWTTGGATPNASKYPMDLQNRGRDLDVSTQQNTLQRAESFNPSIVAGLSEAAQESTPVVTRQGIVLSGNNRTGTIDLARKATKEGEDPYKAHLIENSAAFGVDPAAIDAMKEPVLVRVVDLDPNSVEARTFAERSNTPMTAAIPGLREAARMTNIIDSDILTSFNTESKTVRSALTEDGALQQKIASRLPAGERAKYVDSEGGLTEAGIDLVKNMVLLKSLPVDVIEGMSVEGKVGMLENVTNALPAVQKVAQFHPTADVLPAMREALRFIAGAKKGKGSLAAAADTADMFQTAAQDLSPAARMMVAGLERQNGPRKLNDALRLYAENLEGSLLAGPMEPPKAFAEAFNVKEAKGAKFGQDPTDALVAVAEAVQAVNKAATAEEVRPAVDDLNRQAAAAQQARHEAAQALARTLTGQIPEGRSIETIASYTPDGVLVAHLRSEAGTFERVQLRSSDRAAFKAFVEADAQKNVAEEASLSAETKSARVSGMYARSIAKAKETLDRLATEETGAIFNPFSLIGKKRPSEEKPANQRQATFDQINKEISRLKDERDVMMRSLDGLGLSLEMRTRLQAAIVDHTTQLGELNRALAKAPLNVVDPDADLKAMSPEQLKAIAGAAGIDVKVYGTGVKGLIKAISEQRRQFNQEVRPRDEALDMAQQAEREYQFHENQGLSFRDFKTSVKDFLGSQVATATPIVRRLNALRKAGNVSAAEILNDTQMHLELLKAGSNIGRQEAYIADAAIGFGKLNRAQRQALDRIIFNRGELTRIKKRGEVGNWTVAKVNEGEANLGRQFGKLNDLGQGNDYLSLHHMADKYFKALDMEIDDLLKNKIIAERSVAGERVSNAEDLRKAGDYSPLRFQELGDSENRPIYRPGGQTQLPRLSKSGTPVEGAAIVMDARALLHRSKIDHRKRVMRTKVLRDLGDVADQFPDNGWVRRIGPDDHRLNKETPVSYLQDGRELRLAVTNSALRGLDIRNISDVAWLVRAGRLLSGTGLIRLMNTGAMAGPRWWINAPALDWWHSLTAVDTFKENPFFRATPGATSATLAANLKAVAGQTLTAGSAPKPGEINFAREYINGAGRPLAPLGSKLDVDTVGKLQQELSKLTDATLGSGASEKISIGLDKTERTLNYIANTEELMFRAAWTRARYLELAGPDALSKPVNEKLMEKAVHSAYSRLMFNDGNRAIQLFDTVIRPYASASVQATRGPARALTSHPIQSAKTVTMITGAGAAAYYLAKSVTDNDENEIDDIGRRMPYGVQIALPRWVSGVLEDGTRSKVLTFQAPVDQPLRPLAAFGWATAKAYDTGKAKDFALVAEAAKNVASMEHFGMLPPTVQAYVSYILNRDLYTGNELFHGASKDIMASTEDSPDTSATARMIASATGLSAPRLQRAAQNELAINRGFGRYVGAGTDLIAEKVFGFPGAVSDQEKIAFKENMPGAKGKVQDAIAWMASTPIVSDAQGAFLKTSAPGAGQRVAEQRDAEYFKSAVRMFNNAADRLYAEEANKAAHSGALVDPGSPAFEKYFDSIPDPEVEKRVRDRMENRYNYDVIRKYISPENQPIIADVIGSASTPAEASMRLAIHAVNSADASKAFEDMQIVSDLTKAAEAGIKKTEWWTEFELRLRQDIAFVQEGAQQGMTRQDMRRGLVDRQINQGAGMSQPPEPLLDRMLQSIGAK